MKLVSFSIKNYRSIAGASKLRIREGMTTLIGPNNEGKSNVLRAMVVALEIASRLDEYTILRGGRLRPLRMHSGSYSWASDYPIQLQAPESPGLSEFEMEFQLTEPEVEDFRSEVGSNLNGTLPIRIAIGAAEPTFTVRKKGPGGKALSAKASLIGRFIARRIDLQHIPAVRPASAATEVVQHIVARELAALEHDAEYQSAVDRIESLQQPVLARISQSLRGTLKVFLPNVKDVQVDVPRAARYRALTRSCEVIVDDGTPTNLSRKGDGVQSLAALSLMRHASEAGSKGKHVILAIEEPESHLHPNAIHQLRGVLLELAKQHQVIITTHCPLFVDRRDIRSNILVVDSRAKPAQSVQQVRDTMGIRVSDNLTAAEVLLIVEGEEDRKAMGALLSVHSKAIAAALQSGVLAIDTLAGAGNLAYKLTQAREAMCTTHAIVDHDASGRDAVKRATAQGILQVADVAFTSCLGMKDSELEDWYDAALLMPAISTAFGLPAVHPLYTGVKKKWSDRMRELFIAHGKPWDDSIQMRLKWLVADSVSRNPRVALLGARRAAFDNLVGSLEAKIATAPTRPAA